MHFKVHKMRITKPKSHQNIYLAILKIAIFWVSIFIEFNYKEWLGQKMSSSSSA